MSALDDLAEKIATARAMPQPFGMVVLTADEAQAVLDEVDRIANSQGRAVDRMAISHGGPPHDGDDDVT